MTTPEPTPDSADRTSAAGGDVDAQIQRAAAEERRAAKKMDLGGTVVLLIVSVVLVVANLVLPQTAGVRGYQVLAGAGDVSPMESVFAYGTAATAVMTLLTLLTRRTEVGWIAWMLSGFSFFAAVWAFWALGFEQGASIGFFAALLANLCALVGFSRVAMRKSPEQLAAQERLRAAVSQLDEVGQTQAATRKAFASNELLVDDRRARAAERHRRDEQ